MKRLSILVVLYATSVALYGALEIGHDLLHHLSAWDWLAMHSHKHAHHHSIRDHHAGHRQMHETLAHHHNDHAEDETSHSIISLIWFIHPKPLFRFSNLLLDSLPGSNEFMIRPPASLPVTPPPESRLLLT